MYLKHILQKYNLKIHLRILRLAFDLPEKNVLLNP